jgi:hypothetical protein
VVRRDIVHEVCLGLLKSLLAAVCASAAVWLVLTAMSGGERKYGAERGAALAFGIVFARQATRAVLRSRRSAPGAKAKSDQPPA